MAALLVMAMALDAILGEPKWLWDRMPHPAVLMGRAVSALDRTLNTGSHRRLKGGLCVALLVGGAFLLGLGVTHLPFGPLWSTLGAAILLAQRSLTDHVADVARALSRSLEDGRLSVARIVGRDTAEMDAPAVARSAIESAAENLSDGVVAPAFWFLLLGLPGILVYKVINTADSMIGYRTEAYEDFGKAAARLDDLLNWVPARLTALTITGLAGLWRHGSRIIAEARRHRSPNAGWPEAAAARALDVALSGPRSYHGQLQDFPFVHPEGKREIGAPDIDRAVSLLWRVWWVLLAFFFLLSLVGL